MLLSRTELNVVLYCSGTNERKYKYDPNQYEERAEARLGSGIFQHARMLKRSVTFVEEKILTQQRYVQKKSLKS